MNDNSRKKADIKLPNIFGMWSQPRMNTENKALLAKEFYSRQTIMKELGQEGQSRLAKSTVTIVGVGGLGTVAALYLALAGVGKLRLIDQDIVEIKNLHRQILYNTQDLDYPKAEVAAARLKKANPLIETEAISENVNAGNVDRLLKGSDCVVDGLDNMATRYLINRVCVKIKVPYVFGAAIGMEGNLSVFSAPETPCLECVLPNLSDNEMMKCDTRGVLGVTPGIIGAMQAFEAIKILTGMGAALKGKLMICDFSDMYFTTIDVAKRTDCPSCKGTLPKALKERLVWLCGQNTANINPEKPLKMSLIQVHDRIQQHGLHIRVKSRLALMFDFKGVEVSFFNGGRMLIKNVADEKAAVAAYRAILSELELV